jgi:dolichol-phosphate mannosyltransferase
MISIITPTYNEAKNISNLIKEIDKAMKGREYEIVVADDNSPDGTADIASNLKEKYNVTVLLRTKNKGLSPAVCDGFNIAKGNILGVIDADLSHPPKIIPQLIDAMEKEKADIAVASRLVRGGGTEAWPAKRKITSYIATMLAKPITSIKDPMSGFFFLRREVLDGAELKPKGYKILLEILVKGNYKKAIEYPFIFRDRTAGDSKLSIKTNIQYLQQLSSLYLYSLMHPKRIIKRIFF